MSISQTGNRTGTSTFARHISAKIATDLKRIQQLIGKGIDPSDQEIDKYQIEATLLLQYEAIQEITYGFKKNGKWVFAVKYKEINSSLSGGDKPVGTLPMAVANANFCSYLIPKYDISSINGLPFNRVESVQPGVDGCWEKDRDYISGSLGVKREIYSL